MAGRIGIAGATLDGLALLYKVNKGSAKTSDYLKFGVNVALTFVAISNPIGLAAVAGYAILDASGVLNGAWKGLDNYLEDRW